MNSTKGLRDWILQRISALYMIAYFIFLAIVLAMNAPFSFSTWKILFSAVWMQVPALIFWVCLLWHAWIGVWTILTDYVHSACLRSLLKILLLFALLVYFFWGVQILWGLPVIWSLA